MRNRIKTSERKAHVASSNELPKQRKINPHFKYYPENERVIHKEIMQMFSSLGVTHDDRQLSKFTPVPALKARQETRLIQVGSHLSDIQRIIPDYEKKCFTYIHEEEEMPLPVLESVVLNGITIIEPEYNFVKQR